MIRLSYSSLNLFHSCPRKFQLLKLLKGETEREESPSLIFGSAFGIGVQTYLSTQSQSQALYAAWKAYYPILEDKIKTESNLLFLLKSSFSHLDNLLAEWEVPTFKGKKALELSFRLNISEDFYYVGYIDVVLQNRFTGSMAILEVKTTGLSLLSLDALYQNSGQALGYSIVLDQICGKENSLYEVIYFAGQVLKTQFDCRIHTNIYNKNLNDRLNWFIALSMDVQNLETMIENNIFPLRGNGCLSYMRACPFLGNCQLHSTDQPKEEEEDTTEYDFTFDLNEVVDNHLERMK